LALDFSTLEKQHFCAELRLNQRGAPELYLEVLAIARVENQFHWVERDSLWNMP